MQVTVVKLFVWVALLSTVPVGNCNRRIIKDSSEDTEQDFYVDYEGENIPTELSSHNEGLVNISTLDNNLEEDDEGFTSSGTDLDEEDSSGDGSVEKYDDSATPRDFAFSESQQNTTGSSSTVDDWDEEKNIAYRMKLSWFLVVLWSLTCVLLSALVAYYIVLCARNQKHRRTAIFSLCRTGYHQQVDAV